MNAEKFMFGRTIEASDVEEIDELLILGKNIKSERLAAGLTQASLAESCGISIDTLARIESGSETVAVGTVVKIAEQLKVSVAKLFDPEKINLSTGSHEVFIRNLRSTLKARGLTVVKFAEDADIELATMRNYFSGHRKPSAQNLVKISKTLGLHPSDLWLDQSKAPAVSSEPKKEEESLDLKEKIYREIILDLLKQNK